MLTDAIYVPRYTAYAITYYADNPKRIWYNRARFEQRYGAGDSEHRGMIMATMESMRGTYAYDLSYWVQQGKLLWFNPVDMTLHTAPVEEFPYRDIHDDSLSLSPMYF